MDTNLLKKYEILISKNKQEKEELISYIKDKTTILLKEKEIILEGKKISIQTSSLKKSILFKNNIKNLLQEKGYVM